MSTPKEFLKKLRMLGDFCDCSQCFFATYVNFGKSDRMYSCIRLQLSKLLSSKLRLSDLLNVQILLLE